jgi:selenocysteine lyase/cysteine desulfurase
MDNLPLYRSWFPHIPTGKIWLNHAAISPISTRVRRVMDAYLDNRSSGDIDNFFSAAKTSAKTKQNLSLLLNTTPDRIGFVMNTSEGLNILANGIQWNSGDRIILNDIEFPTNVVPFINLKRFGVEIDFVKSVNGAVRIEDIESLITPRTKLLSISFVQFFSGFKANMNAIGELCKRKNIIFCVDAIQGLGAAPFDVKAAQIDFVSGGGNKWLMGTLGLGYVYMTGELQERITQVNAGWTSNKNFFGDFFNYRIDFDDTARRFENGTLNIFGITALAESTSTLLEVGLEQIHSHLLSLTDRVAQYAFQNGIEIVTPIDHADRAGIMTLKVPDAERIFKALLQRNIVVSLREGMLRIAPHFYTSTDDIDAFLTTFTELRKRPV